MRNKLKESIQKVIDRESGTYQLMTSKMRAIDLDRCGDTLAQSICDHIEGQSIRCSAKK